MSFAQNFLEYIGPDAHGRKIRVTNTPLQQADTYAVMIANFTGDPKADLLVIAGTTMGVTPTAGQYDLGYLFSSQTINSFTGTAGIPELTTASRQTTIRTTQQFPSLKSAVAGDVNGDGWQDLLVGSSLVTQFNSTGTSIVLQNLVSPASNATPMTLGDLNADGYDDFGLSHVNRLDIFLGKQNTSYILSDILGSVPYFKVTGRGLSATEGDFNADGIPDLAVASLASLAAGGEQLSVFWSLVNRSTRSLTLADANVTFPIREAGVVGDFSLSLPQLDLNNDGIEDLAVGTYVPAGATGDDTGRVHLIYGSRPRIAIPTAFDTLENVSVPGSGSFVANRGTGRPELFPGGDLTYTFEPGTNERWFQFSTLGDGIGGDGIRIVTHATRSAPTPGTPGFPNSENIDNADWNLNPDPNITEATSIPHTTIVAVGDNRIHDYAFFVTAGSRGIFDVDQNNFDTFMFLFDGNGNRLAFSQDFTFDPGDDPRPPITRFDDS